MGSLGNAELLSKSFQVLCRISPKDMENGEQKPSVADRINAARQCLDTITAMVREEEGVDASAEGILRQFATCLDVVGSVAQDPSWADRRNKHRAEEVLQAVFESVSSSRTMAQVLLAEAPGTPSSTPPCSPPDFSASFDASAVSGGSGADSGADAQRDIDALRRPVTAAMRLCSVAGMAQAKQLLTEAVLMPIRYRHLFTGALKPWHSVLLYGPPGTGKTKLALALAAEVDAELYALSPADLLSSWFGRTEQNIRDLFGQLRSRGASRRVIVFLDEVDGLCRRRTNEEPESTRRMKTELLTQLQDDAGVAAAPREAAGAAGAQAGHLFFISATNCPWEIDPAFLRRFQRRIFIGLPDRASRQEMIRTMAAGVAALDLPVDEWSNLLDRTEGFSGSDLCDLVKNALYQPVRELTTVTHWCAVGGGLWAPCPSNTLGAVRRPLHHIPAEVVRPRSVTLRDFQDAIEGARPTVCQEDLQRYEDFTNQFGQWG